MYFEFMANELL